METVDVRVPVVTVMGTCPIPPGETTVIDVSALFTSPTEISVVPKVTIELVVNPAPFMVTVVPPFALPEAGFIPVTTGM